MRVLAVAPWAPDATRTRARGLLRLLAEEHEVDLVHAAWDDRDRIDPGALGLRESVAVPLRRPASAARALAAVGTRRPMQIAYLDAPALRRAVRRRWESGRYDVLYLNVFRTLHLASITSGRHVVADLDEMRSDYWSAAAAGSTHPLRRLVGGLEAPRMRRWEQTACTRFARVLLSNEADAADAPRGALVRSPHGIEVRGAGAPRTGGSLVFVGRLGYAANEEALLWFARTVLPRIRALRPAVHLDVVGRGAGVRLRHELARLGDAVRFHGEVEHVEPFYDGAAVSVVPVRLATGVQLKLLESFARGTPTICTPRVAALAGVEDGRQCLVADSEQEWVDATLTLLDRPEAGARLAGAATSWLEAFSESAVRRQLRAALETVPGRVGDGAGRG